MTPPIPRGPRTALAALLGAGLSLGLLVAPARAETVVERSLRLQTALPADAPPPAPPGDEAVTTPGPLGQRDRQLLGAARAEGKKYVTVMVATARGTTPGVVRQLTRMGGVVGAREDALGYVRLALPVGAVAKAGALRQVLGLDLNDTVALDVPAPEGAATTAVQDGPGPGTPAANPFLPTAETGAVDFVRSHPTWDGRGVTIGVLDSGVDLDHPALATTTTGQPKVTDWFSATDPLVDGDETWLAMRTAVTGPTFTAGRPWTSPAGSFFFATFEESVTATSEYAGDVNRDGDTTDTWGVLYRASDKAVWVDVDQDGDFTDEEVRRPYREDFQVGHLGTDDPSTAVRESVPFTVEVREDVDLGPAGATGTADFVNLGIVTDSHGSHVAGITAGHALFGGAVDGAAPGASVVSAQACLLGGGCSNVALTEGMIGLVADRHVDVVNMSIGGLPALNDGDNVRATVYNRLVDDYGVQLFFSAGNNGPGLNTVGDPSVADKVVSVGASVSDDTYRANYGASVRAPHGVFNFSARGPREDGGMKPNLTAPGSAISTVPQWLPGVAVPEAGYELPPGYAMINGTSMAAPQAAGAAALLLSAGRGADVPVTAKKLRGALYSSAKFDPTVSAEAQGVGELRVAQAWNLLARDAAFGPRTIKVSAPVCTPQSDLLVRPDRGVGVYNRCAAGDGGQTPGRATAYRVVLTRSGGSAATTTHRLSWLGNDGTFTAPTSVRLPRGKAVTVTVTSKAGLGRHSAILRVDDTRTLGVDGWVPMTVAVSAPLRAPSATATFDGRATRLSTTSYFVTVPEGARALQVGLSGLAAGSRVNFQAFHPFGLEADPDSDIGCSTNVAVGCNPRLRSYPDPEPGVWELTVQGARTTPFSSNPFRLTAQAQGVTVEPAVLRLATATVGQAAPVEWELTNDFASTTVVGEGGPLGSRRSERPGIQQGQTQTYQVTVPAGVDQLDVAIGNPSEAATDLDLEVSFGGELLGASLSSGADERVVVDDPAAGVYTVRVNGYAVTGTVEYDYSDTLRSTDLFGELRVDESPVLLPTDDSAPLAGEVVPAGPTGTGRELVGDLVVLNEGAVQVGEGSVVVGEVLGG